MMTRPSLGATAALVLLVSVVAGCAPSPPPGTFLAPAPPPPKGDYVVQPGDTLEVKFFYHPTHDQNNIVVRQDGKIDLPLVGPVLVAGKTPTQLSEELAAKYGAELRDPKLAVTVKDTVKLGVYVGGEVIRPGYIPYRQGLTALQALLEAGGPKDTALVEQVVLLQREGQFSWRPSKIDLQKVLLGDTSGDLQIGPSDVMFVPKTAVAEVNLWMQQYIRNNLPFNPGLSITPFFQ
jgi:protein involved in polysaccharide export with SLBB domain